MRNATAKNAKLIADQSAKLADYASESLVVAEKLRMKTKPVDRLVLSKDDRAALAALSTIPQSLRKKLPKKESKFTVAESVSLAAAAAKEMPGADVRQQIALMAATRNLMECLTNTLLDSKQARCAMQANPSSLSTKIV